jgi:hypothetical protein
MAAYKKSQRWTSPYGEVDYTGDPVAPQKDALRGGLKDESCYPGPTPGKFVQGDVYKTESYKVNVDQLLRKGASGFSGKLDKQGQNVKGRADEKGQDNE